MSSFNKVVMKDSKHLRVLKLPPSQFCNDESVKEIFRHNHNLQQLDLTNCTHLKDGSLQPLVTNCKVISIRICDFINKDIFSVHGTVFFSETRSFNF